MNIDKEKANCKNKLWKKTPPKVAKHKDTSV